MGLEEREKKRNNVVSNLVGGSEKPEPEKTLKEENYIVRSYKITSDSHRKIKLRAFDEGKKDYEIVQEALDAYFGL
jgi:hypothetical protein